MDARTDVARKRTVASTRDDEKRTKTARAHWREWGGSGVTGRDSWRVPVSES